MVNSDNLYWLFHGCFAIKRALDSILFNLDEFLACLDQDDPDVKKLVDSVDSMRSYFDFESWFLDEK